MTDPGPSSPSPRPAIAKILRALVVFEAVSTLFGAIWNFVDPAGALAPMMTDPGAQAQAALSLASSAWVALSLLLLGSLMLRPGDERALRIVIAPVLVGDLVHIGAVVWLVGAHGSWTGTAIGIIGSIVLFFAYRAVILWRPQLYL